jgi:hypothetical protein
VRAKQLPAAAAAEAPGTGSPNDSSAAHPVPREALESSVDREPYWERVVRPLESLPLGSLWLGLGLAGAIIGVYLLWCALLAPGEPLLEPGGPFALAPETCIHGVVAILTAFLLAVRRYDVRRSREDLQSLHSLTCCTRAELARIVERRRSIDRRRLRLATVIGVATGLVIAPATSGDPGMFLRAGAWDARLVWGVLATAVLFAVMARGVYATIMARRLLELVTHEIVRIDLLDRSSLAPFAHQGLRHAFYWVGGSSIASLLAFELDRAGPLFAILAGTLFMGTLALLEPARAIHARLREAKRAELSRVRDRIVRARDVALGATPEPGGSAAVELPGLLAYESRIEAVSEWPFDVPTLLRFGALLTLAVGSWLGGAVVERLLGSMLG